MKNSIKISIIAAIFFTVAVPINAQNVNNDFESFRSGILKNYNNYRKSVLDDYSKFLEQAWKDFDAFRGVERDKTPKPKQTPVAPKNPPKSDPVVQTPKTPSIPVPRPDVPTPDSPTTPSSPTKPITPPVSPLLPTQERKMAFYDLSFNVPDVSISCLSNVTNKESLKYAWRNLSESDVADKVLPSLTQISSALSLPDWFFIELVHTYSKTSVSNAFAQVALTHYLLCNAGYDVRLANSDAQPLLLICVKQMIYGRAYLKFDEDDVRRYFVFGNDLTAEIDTGMSLWSCPIPKDFDCGRSVDLIIRQPLTLPDANSRSFVLTDKRLTIKDKVNTTLIKMLDKYPQMDVPDYARCVPDERLRKSIVAQFKNQVSSDKKTAVSQLLSFCHHAFEYATDGDQFGREKPFFVEENFYWPKNDCEDRAIFFTYLLRNVLGIDNVLLHYPGHEAAALSSILFDRGDGFVYNRKKYVIADPTYINASVGMCMPQFKTTDPEVEVWY